MLALCFPILDISLFLQCRVSLRTLDMMNESHWPIISRDGGADMTSGGKTGSQIFDRKWVSLIPNRLILDFSDRISVHFACPSQIVLKSNLKKSWMCGNLSQSDMLATNNKQGIFWKPKDVTGMKSKLST